MIQLNNLKEIYDKLPDEEVLLDFDPFFVGDGSKDLSDNPHRFGKFNDQLMNIANVSDLKVKHVDTVSRLNSDLDDWGVEHTIDGDILDYFISEKKRAFDIFDYLRIKSSHTNSRLLKERDLISSDDDMYLIDYLIELGKCTKGRLKGLAQLLANQEMGFTEIKYINECTCGICKSASGGVYPIKSIVSLMGSESSFLHSNSIGEFVPVIRTRIAYDDLDLDHAEFNIGKTIVEGMPKEWAKFFKGFDFPFEVLKFIDFSSIDGWSGEVVKKLGNTLIVHNGYVGSYSPFEYLSTWLTSKDIEPTSTILVEGTEDIFYYNGVKVVEKDGRYIDLETGSILRI